MIKREEIEWCDIWITCANPRLLPRILLIGDSIARSYFGEVAKALQGRVLCSRLATSKSICDPSFRDELCLVLDEYEFALIHFNNGLHGWAYDEGSYREQLFQIMHFIRERAKGSALIWANTTPIRNPNNRGQPDGRTARVRERNRIAMEYASVNHIPVNDLFEVVKDHPEYFAEDGIHFNVAGQTVLGRQVSRCILNQLAANAGPGA